MVPGAGIEPARPYERGILSPLRLPIPPPWPDTFIRNCESQITSECIEIVYFLSVTAL